MRLVAEVEHLDAAVAAHDADPLLGVRPFVHHQMVGERLETVDALAVDMGQEFGPLVGSLDRCAHHAEVDSVEVGEHDESVAPVINLVLDTLCAAAHAAGRGVGCVGGDDPRLGGVLVGGVDDDPFLAAGEVDADVERLVGLVEHQDVGALVGAQGVPPHLCGAHLVVGSHVDEGARVGGPCRTTPGRHTLHHFVDVGAGGEVAEADGVLLAAVEVGCPRQPALVGAHVEDAQREVVVALGFEVLVDEHHLGGGVSTGAAAVDGITGALLGAAGVPPLALADRYGHVGLLHPALQLVEQRLGQRRVRGEPGVGVGVLGLEIGDGVGVVAVA